jgi:hypothetical protein
VFISQGMDVEISVVRSFDFLITTSSRNLKNKRLKQMLVSIFEKLESKNCNFVYFKNLKKPQGFMMEPTKN